MAAAEPRADSAHATALIRAFVDPARQERLIELLTSKRGRDKLRSGLAHFDALDRRFAHRVDAARQDATAIAALLRAAGAPETCTMLAESQMLDGRAMPLDAALHAVVGRGMGAFVSCIPGQLGYFEGEEPGERYILRRLGGASVSSRS